MGLDTAEGVIIETGMEASSPARGCRVGSFSGICLTPTCRSFRLHLAAIMNEIRRSSIFSPDNLAEEPLIHDSGVVSDPVGCEFGEGGDIGDAARVEILHHRDAEILVHDQGEVDPGQSQIAPAATGRRPGEWSRSRRVPVGGEGRGMGHLHPGCLPENDHKSALHVSSVSGT